MTKKLQITTVFVLFLLLALSNMAMSASADALLSPTPTRLSPTPTLVSIKPEATVTRMVKTPQPTPTWSPSPTQLVKEGPTKTKTPSSVRTMRVGNSDWIVTIGFLIVAIIVIPLLFKYKEWRGN